VRHARIGSVRGVVVALIGLVSLSSDVDAQDAVVRGRVSVDGAGAANVMVAAVGADGATLRRTVTGPDGTYEFEVDGGTVDIVASGFGYAEARQDGLALSPGSTTTVDFDLVIEPFSLSGVSVTGARRPQKALETAASISVVDVNDMAARHAVTPLDHVEGVPGVDIASQGIQARQVSTRGFNGIFGQNLTLLTDYRHASAPALRVNLSQTIVPIPEDVERIEILRGPASALYGPSAADGVIHIITKSPFESVGTSAELVGGGRSLFQGTFRHARTLGDNLAVRLSGQYFRGEEWEVTPLPTELQPRDPIQERAAGELRIDGRFGGTEAVFTFGHFQGMRYVEQTEIGASQVRDWQVDHAQLRVTRGRLFAQAYVNWNDAGETRPLQTLAPIVDDSRLYAAQVQYGTDLRDRASLTYGIDFQRTDPKTGGTISGRNENDDTIDELGAYVQADVRLTAALRLVAASRLDDHSRLPHAVWSPQVGLVLEPAEGQALRLTFNRAFTPPVPTELGLDILAGSFDPLPFDLRARGVPLTGFNWRPACGGAYCMESPFAPPGPLPIEATGFWPVVVQAMLAGGVDLSAIPAPTSADVGTSLRILDLGTGAYGPHDGSFPAIDALEPTLSNTFELGYKGVFSDRVGVGIDVYYTRRRDFTGALSVVTPNAFLNTADLAAYLSAYMPAVQAAGLAAVIGGVDGEPTLTGIPLGTVVPDDPLAGSDVLITNRNFGEIDLWGADLSVEVVLSDRFTWSGTYSHISDNFFSAAELGEDFTLNAPRHKAFTSLDYRDRESERWGSIRLRGVGAFRQVQGVWQGDVDGFYSIDAEIGAAIAPRVSLALAVRNLTDKIHQEFVGAPMIGRLFLVKAQYRR